MRNFKINITNNFFINFLLSTFKLITFLLFTCNFSYSQDIHFSQYDSSPLNLNPALTGLVDCDYRFVANHRNQWQSVTVPYRTISASFDMKYIFANSEKISYGFGILINTDKAGDSEFGTNQVKLEGAVHYLATPDSTLTASLGISMNMSQNSINYTNLYFGNQYNGYQYDPDLPTNEVFQEKSLQYIDFNIGGHIKYIINSKTPLNIGFAFFHLNRPKQSFNLDREIVMDRRFIVHANSILNLSDQIKFLPGILVMGQGKYHEVDAGGLLKFKTNSMSFKAIYAGGWYRFKDAGIIKFAFDYQNFNIGMSYDINTSSLKKASNGLGGLELSLIYNFCNPKSVIIPSSKQCPVYF